MIIIDNERTLFDTLNEILNDVNSDKIKEIIVTLSKINQLKKTIEHNLTEEVFYEKILQELKREFKIVNFKIIHIKDSCESALFQEGELDEYKYLFRNILSNNIQINIFIDYKSLTEYQIMSLNTYFKELTHLFYMNFILNDLEKSATIDPLTQLQNRISFNIEMKALVPLAIRERMRFGVLLINIDRFRAVNDEHGDEFGDDFLKLYANTIKDIIRTSDIAVRFAGGEFLVLLVNVESEEMTMKIAEKIKNKLADVYLISPNHDKFKKTVSIGISMFPEDSNDIHEVVKFCEMALHDARDNGRNCLVRYKNVHSGSIEFF